jgi:hypothetical protein
VSRWPVAELFLLFGVVSQFLIFLKQQYEPNNRFTSAANSYFHDKTISLHTWTGQRLTLIMGSVRFWIFHSSRSHSVEGTNKSAWTISNYVPLHFVKYSSNGKMLQTELTDTKNSILQATSQFSLNDEPVLRKVLNVKFTRRQLWITFWETIIYKWDFFLSIKRHSTRSNKSRLRTCYIPTAFITEYYNTYYWSYLNTMKVLPSRGNATKYTVPISTAWCANIVRPTKIAKHIYIPHS